MAVGLGELRGIAMLGERPRLEIDVLGTERMSFDVTCFSLRPPKGAAGVPWLQKGQLNLRRGKPPVLQISSHLTLVEPALAVAIHIGCGQDVVREYVVLVGTPGKQPSSLPPARFAFSESPATSVQQAAGSARTPAPVQPQAQAPRPVVQPPLPATPAADPVIGADDKVRAMELQVAALQQRATDLTQRIEQAAPQSAAPVAPASEAAQPPAPVVAPAKPLPPPREQDGGWGFFWLVAVLVAAVAGWFGWRSYRDRRDAEDEAELAAPPIRVDARRAGERDERGGAELDVEPSAMATAPKIDMKATAKSAGGNATHDSMMSIAAASLDEHFEANPVIELAEIMLSFGRVKGAAQALQEFIDTNPKEALKPWIRLLDVYRMAGMRHEFERVAGELNRHFNVQVQRWEDSDEAGHTRIDVLVDGERPPASPAGGGLEEMPRVVEQVVSGWRTDDAVAVLDDLLRDNRDGARVGFPLPVVDDLLFLIDLKETVKKMDKENEKS